MRIHHIGYLVKKIEKARAAFVKLGYEIETEIVYDDIRKADICFLKKDGYRVELVSPVSDDSVVANLIRQYRNAPYHLCYASDSFEQDCASLESGGYVRMGEDCPAPAMGGKKVAFFFSSAIGIVEVAEEA